MPDPLLQNSGSCADCTSHPHAHPSVCPEDAADGPRNTVPLSNETLSQVQRCGAEVPNYSRPTLNEPNLICHLGVGGFHRAHAAFYTDQLLRDGLTGWAEVGFGGNKELAKGLEAQDNLYTVINLQRDGALGARVIGVLSCLPHA